MSGGRACVMRVRPSSVCSEEACRLFWIVAAPVVELRRARVTVPRRLLHVLQLCTVLQRRRDEGRAGPAPPGECHKLRPTLCAQPGAGGQANSAQLRALAAEDPDFLADLIEGETNLLELIAILDASIRPRAMVPSHGRRPLARIRARRSESTTSRPTARSSTSRATSSPSD